MATLVYILGTAIFIFPLIIFLDYNKPHNFFYGFIYLLFFGFVVWIVLPLLTETPERGLVFAMSCPFVIAIYLFMAKKRKGKTAELKKKKDVRVIDDL